MVVTNASSEILSYHGLLERRSFAALPAELLSWLEVGKQLSTSHIEFSAVGCSPGHHILDDSTCVSANLIRYSPSLSVSSL